MLKKIISKIIHNFLTKPITYIGGFFINLFYKPKEREFDTSWKTARERIYNYGMDYWEKQLLNLGVEKLPIDVIEIGSGNGQWLITFAKFASKIVGIEPSDLIRNYSANKLKEYGFEQKVELKKGFAESIPYANESFDLLFCSGVFMFVNQKKALKEFNRVLRNGGKLILTVNGLGYFIMYLKRGMKFYSIEKTSYGIEGIINTIIKWITGKEFGTSAVSISEIEKIMHENGFDIHDRRVWIQENLYALDHFGFPTNYVFIATKTEINN